MEGSRKEETGKGFIPNDLKHNKLSDLGEAGVLPNSATHQILVNGKWTAFIKCVFVTTAHSKLYSIATHSYTHIHRRRQTREQKLAGQKSVKQNKAFSFSKPHKKGRPKNTHV